jgi:hypothetical protein
VRIAVFALLSIALLGCAGTNRTVATPVAAQQAAAAKCLHGDNEVPEQRARRLAALALARDVNTMQAMTAQKSKGLYQPLANLALNRPVPEGFRLQVSTDGASYAFSAKDTTDPCLFAFFSDQTGIILHGRAIQ